ncbi:hypothetical protein HY477_02210 [Candidatus Uhrbacteria bacterium]|nr:hypothetical protein [Candidatus Uhrbacteria bacterium]
MQSQASKIIGVVIITAIIVGGGMYFWQKQQSQEINLLSQETVAEQEPQWQVVTDVQGGYTIKYPPNWIKVELEHDNGFNVGPGVGGFGLTLRYYDNTERTQEEIASQIGYTPGTERFEERINIEINGRDALKIYVTTSPSTDPTTAVVLEAYEKVFVLETQHSPQEFETFYKSFRLLN